MLSAAEQPIADQRVPLLEPGIANHVRWRFGSQEHAAAPDIERALIADCTMVVCTYRRAASLRRFLDSLLRQSRRPAGLMIVDASPDTETMQAVQQYLAVERVAQACDYIRVDASLSGLTRQRNFALRHVATDLIVFCDDDVVLMPDCLEVMERIFRQGDGRIVGVGVRIHDQEFGWLPLFWRLQRVLGMVPSLQPGKYYRSGMVTTWDRPPQRDEVVDVDWLAGFTMLLKTSVARAVGFNDAFSGYSLGEDLDFSVRASRHGRLVVGSAARVWHLQDLSGRPDLFKLGYMEIYNRYHIHCRAFPDRRARDVAWFAYAWALDTLLLLRHALVPGRWGGMFRQIAGRLYGAYDVVRGR